MMMMIIQDTRERIVDKTRTVGLSKQITIKIGVKFMIKRNIDAILGLVNDTITIIISIVQDTITDNIENIKLLLSSGLEYFIERVSIKFQVMDRAYVIRKQCPLSLCYVTIHKRQRSLQNVIMNIIPYLVVVRFMLHYLE